jgi:hypothetical protein
MKGKRKKVFGPNRWFDYQKDLFLKLIKKFLNNEGCSDNPP